jgi:hypothetical protein
LGLGRAEDTIDLSVSLRGHLVCAFDQEFPAIAFKIIPLLCFGENGNDWLW